MGGETPELACPDCDDAAACAAGFEIEGMFYGQSCAAVREDAVSSDVLAEGELGSRTTTVNRIEGVDTTVMVAVGLPGGICGDNDTARSPWSMAFAPEADQAAVKQAVCSVGDLTPEQREANGC